MKSVRDRTAVDVAGQVYRDLRSYADETGIKMTVIVEQALKSYLKAPTHPARNINEKELTIMSNTALVELMMYAAVNNLHLRDVIDDAIMVYINSQRCLELSADRLRDAVDGKAWAKQVNAEIEERLDQEVKS